MWHRIIIVSIFCLCIINASADNYFVYFHDKSGTCDISCPETFLSQRAIERRTRQNIPLDSTDLPVSPLYLDSLRQLGAQILHCSKWINGATIETDSVTSRIIRQLDFVDSVQITKSATDSVSNAPRMKMPLRVPNLEYGYARRQIEMLNLHKLHTAGFCGKNMLVAVVDNGFLNADHIDALAQIRPNIVDTFSFVKGYGTIYQDGSHGTYVLSIIGASLFKQFQGAATETSFALIRSEDNETETMLEVDNQVAAFERADSIGADIINSSLGYYIFDDTTSNFTYADLDGRTARNSIAATMAARKGMVVCIAAGNEGSSAWHFIDTPADADSILCVGSVDSLRLHSYFSSYGPASDGRIKPDICTMGEYSYVISSSGQTSRGSGTSFASPLAAGMVACLWSALPQLTNMEIIELIKQHSSNASFPDCSIGYGIPDAWECYLSVATDIDNSHINDNSFSDRPVLYFDILGRRLHQLPPDAVIIRRLPAPDHAIILYR